MGQDLLDINYGYQLRTEKKNYVGTGTKGGKVFRSSIQRVTYTHAVGFFFIYDSQNDTRKYLEDIVEGADYYATFHTRLELAQKTQRYLIKNYVKHFPEGTDMTQIFEIVELQQLDNKEYNRQRKEAKSRG